MTAEIDGRRMRGDASRRLILARAVDLASIEGLDQLSIGRIANAASVGKSSVATLFGTKERLQLGAVEAASERFIETVIVPARSQPRGIHRLIALLGNWLDYSESRVFPGGCFFAAVAADFDAKPGVVRDAIARALIDWEHYLASACAHAVANGELAADCDSAQFAFESSALLDAANNRSLIRDSAEPYRRARGALVARLEQLGADPAVASALLGEK